ncbi:Guanylate cyclase [Labeo rohita]|uniref:Guanylate cyclase n=1 Tax=Labeo rohita TaxID=84645 RepID=A0ABQ8L839_LABRO|nr:Guanylate cyclase [Labeo rohita]
MPNIRSKLHKAGCIDVTVNGGRKGKYCPEGQPPKQNIKKYEEMKLFTSQISLWDRTKYLLKKIGNCLLKKSPNKTLVAHKMDQTFPLRRKEIVETEPPIRTMLERWPALFTEREVFAEFTRIACKNLQNEFFGELDKHTPCLMKIFKSKTGTLGQTLAELLEQVETRRNTNQASCQVCLFMCGCSFISYCYCMCLKLDLTLIFQLNILLMCLQIKTYKDI